jgi:hypothetical protein
MSNGEVTLAEFLATLSEQRTWIKRYLAGEQDAVINEVLSEIVGHTVNSGESEELFGSDKREALQSALTAVHTVISLEWPGAVPHIHVC